MPKTHPAVEQWFRCWNTGQIEDLPITEDFSHTSPFGVIQPKSRYLDIVNKNQDDFLENELTMLNSIQEGNQVCVQFEQKNAKTGLHMVVCEWYVLSGDQIQSIHSFYNVGDAEIRG